VNHGLFHGTTTTPLPGLAGEYEAVLIPLKRIG